MRVINRILITFGLFVSVSFSLYAAQPWGENYAYQDISGYFSLFLFEFWIFLPFFILFLLNNKYKNSNKHLKLLTMVCVLISLSAAYIYFESTVLGSSSTSSLIFLFLPLYQLFFLVITLLTCMGISKTLNKIDTKDVG